MPTIITSNSAAFAQIRALIYAPPNRSKTFSSATMSAFCPTDLTHVIPKGVVKRAAPIKLDDMLWLAFDRGATAGFQQAGIEVPLLDLSGSDMLKWDVEWEETLKLIRDRVARKLTTCLVADTITAFDEMLTYRAGALKGLTKFDLYGDINIGHKRFAMPLKNLGCHVLFLCHAKALMDLPGTSDVAENQRKARKAAGLSGVVPAITGAAINHYRADSTFIFPMTAEKLPDGGVAHFFHTEHPEFEARSRLRLLDAAGQPVKKIAADWREVRKAVGA